MIFPLVSNEKTALTVKNFIKEQRIPHAILILGDGGVGKHTLADFLAKAIVCGKSDAPCDMCDNCRLADSKNHPDISTVAPEDDKKSIVISQIRELRQEAFVKPHKTLKKVFIIDKVDIGEKFDCEKFNRSEDSKPVGFINEILLYGYKNIRQDEIIRKSIVRVREK